MRSQLSLLLPAGSSQCQVVSLSVLCDAGLDCGCCWLRRHSEQSPQRWFVVETRRVTRVCCREPHRPTKAGAPQLVQRCGRQCRPGLAGLPARQWAPLPRGERAPAAGGVSRRVWLGNARGGRSAAELSDRGAGSPSNGSRLVRAGGASLRPLLPYMSCLFYSRAASRLLRVPGSDAAFSHTLLRRARCLRRPRLDIACMSAPPCSPLRCRSC